MKETCHKCGNDKFTYSGGLIICGSCYAEKLIKEPPVTDESKMISAEELEEYLAHPAFHNLHVMANMMTECATTIRTLEAERDKLKDELSNMTIERDMHHREYVRAESEALNIPIEIHKLKSENAELKKATAELVVVAKRMNENFSITYGNGHMTHTYGETIRSAEKLLGK